MALLVAKARLAALPIVAKPNFDCIAGMLNGFGLKPFVPNSIEEKVFNYRGKTTAMGSIRFSGSASRNERTFIP